MQQSWNNGRMQLNGQVRPPMILHSEAEVLIAQNAHNFVWEKYRAEYDALAKQLDNKKKANEDFKKEDDRWREIHSSAKAEIDALIIAEITAYRKERAGSSTLDIKDQLDRIERTLSGLQAASEEAADSAQQAQDAVEELQETVEELKESIEKLLDK